MTEPPRQRSPTKPGLAGTVLWPLVLASVYFVAGKAGLALGAPPDMASAFWPAAGVALAAGILLGRRAWLGVFVGASVLQYSLRASGEFADMAEMVHAISWSAALGGGAWLEMAGASYAARRYLRRVTDLDEFGDIVKLFAICVGGGVINGGYSPLVLALGGQIPWAIVPVTSFTWWVGDALGACVVTPIILLVVAAMASPRERSRALWVCAPMVALALIIVGVFTQARSWEQSRVIGKLSNEAGSRALQVERAMTHHGQTMQTLGAVSTLQPARSGRAGSVLDCSWQREFLESIVGQSPGVAAVAVIFDTQDKAWAGGCSAGSEDLLAQAQMIASKVDVEARAGKPPVFVPLPGSQRSSNSVRHWLMLSVVDHGANSLSAEPEGEGSSAVAPGVAPEWARATLVVLVLDLEALVESASDEPPVPGSAIVLGPADGSARVRVSGGAGEGEPSGFLVVPDSQRELEFGRQTWTMELRISASTLRRLQSWQAFVVLAFGSLIVGLLGMLLLAGAGYTRRTETLVADRTRQLDARARELVAANRELAQFAYAASHDLRSPLRAVATVAEWIEEDLGDDMSEDLRGYIDILRARIGRMDALLDGLLTYATAGRRAEAVRPVDVAELWTRAVELHCVGTSFVGSSEGELPTLTTNALALEQVLTNLVDNAVKHHGEPAGRIMLSVRDLDTHYEFSVEDDGPGIDTQYRERVFGMFHTLARRDEVEGSGLGLALAFKRVESAHGEFSVGVSRWSGAKFVFTWIKAWPSEGQAAAGFEQAA